MPVVQKRKRNPSTYGQIRYHMKRLTAALDKRLREGRPLKYCRLCRAEIRSFCREEKEKQNKLKETIPKKNKHLRRSRRTKNESGSQRCHKRDCRSEAKDGINRQTKNKLESKTMK
ncbi:MAG: hypothetical protein AB2693_23635 [Candidatus Thiodiazotropha sp.]